MKENENKQKPRSSFFRESTSRVAVNWLLCQSSSRDLQKSGANPTTLSYKRQRCKNLQRGKEQSAFLE
jgi:hypothetical protein